MRKVVLKIINHSSRLKKEKHNREGGWIPGLSIDFYDFISPITSLFCFD